MTLNEKFEGMIAKGWPGLKKGSDQYDQLKDAFMGGALCAFHICESAAAKPINEGFVVLTELNSELEQHHKVVKTRAKLWRDIEEAGR